MVDGPVPMKKWKFGERRKKDWKRREKNERGTLYVKIREGKLKTEKAEKEHQKKKGGGGGGKYREGECLQ